MRLTVFALLITVAVALGKEPTQQDYDIWAATLASDASFLRDVVYVWHCVEPTSVFARGSEKGAIEKHPEFRPVVGEWSTEATEIDIERLNAAIKATGVLFPKPVKLLDEETLEKIAGKKPKPAWIVSPRLTEGVEAIFRLSWPAVREDGRAACILYGRFGMWKAQIHCDIINKKPDGRWWPGDCTWRDLLFWGPGWPEGLDKRMFVDE